MYVEGSAVGGEWNVCVIARQCHLPVLAAWMVVRMGLQRQVGVVACKLHSVSRIVRAGARASDATKEIKELNGGVALNSVFSATFKVSAQQRLHANGHVGMFEIETVCRV